MKIYQKIAHLLQAIRNCNESCNVEWLEKHQETLDAIARHCLPRGSGFDAGTTIDEESTPQRIILHTSFHHLDENGFYCGWSDHDVIVSPCLMFDFQTRITGRDKRDIKDYIQSEFNYRLNEDFNECEG